MNLEEIKNRCDNDSYRILHEAETDIEWLIAEVERLENLKYMGVNAEYVETNKQLRTEKAELIEALDTLTLVVGLTAFKYAAQRDVLQEAVDSARQLIPKPAGRQTNEP